VKESAMSDSPRIGPQKQAATVAVTPVHRVMVNGPPPPIVALGRLKQGLADHPSDKS
jgi:hypothetical protein